MNTTLVWSYPMAKVNRFIIEYAEILKDVKIDVDGAKPPSYLVKRFVRIVKSDITEKRYINMCDYPIETILVCAFMGILCNSTNWVEIHDFVSDNVKWLSKFVPFPEDRIPSDDTFRRVFSLIDSEELSTATVKYLLSIFAKIKNAISKYAKENRVNPDFFIDTKKGHVLINIDGKVARGTGRFYDPLVNAKMIPNLQMLNVYDATDGISLFSIPIKDKESEIPIAQEIISKMNLKDKIVTLDALHAQHKTFHLILYRHGDYVIGLKGNQGDAYEEANLIISPDYLNQFHQNSHNYYRIDDKKGNLDKEYFQVPFNKLAIDKGITSEGIVKWSGARNIIVYRHVHHKTGELIVQFFVTSLNDIETAVEAIQGRWDVENLLHRYLDVSFNEDMNKTMDRSAFTNFSIMSKLCLSLLKLAKPLLANRSIIRIKKSFSRKPISYLFSILAILDIDTLEKAFGSK